MTIHQPLYLQNKGYTAKLDRSKLQDVFGSEGILDSSHLVASQVVNYEVSVTPGRCLVQGDTNPNQGLYRFWSDAAVSLTHVPDATNPRVDLIVARVYDSVEVGSGPDSAAIEIVQGTAASGADLANLTGAPGQGGGPAIPATACPLWFALVPTSGGVTQFLDARPRIRSDFRDDIQAGVIDAGSFEVTQASGGAGPSVDVAANVGRGAWIELASGMLVRIAALPATVNLPIATGHATLPRIDRVVLRTGQGGKPLLGVLQGTPTSGATNDNPLGAVSVSEGELLLADVSVPATDTTIANSQIRDRRKWSNGLYKEVVGSGAGNYTATGAPVTTISDYTRRIECSGAPLRVQLFGRAFNTSAGATAIPQIQVDGTTVAWAVITSPAASEQDNFHILSPLSLSAGSHLITVGLAPGGGTGTATLVNSPILSAPALIIEEILRADAANNETTTG